MAADEWLLTAVVLGILTAAFSVIYPFLALADAAIYPMALAIIPTLLSRLPQSNYLWAAYAGTLLFAAAFAAIPQLRQQLRILIAENIYQWIHGLAVVAIGIMAISTNLDKSRQAVYGASALLLLLMVRWPRLLSGWGIALLFFAAGGVNFLNHLEGSPPSTIYTVWSTVFGFTLLIYAILAPRVRSDLPRNGIAFLEWLTASAALLIILMLYGKQQGSLHAYTTVAWGAFAIVQFLAGLFFRQKALRFVALAGFVPCLVRLFAVDTHDTLHRIIASGALGAVFLLIGWLYTKYGSRLAQMER